MTPYHQLWRHAPEDGAYGDCFRTCLGCLMDLPPHEVPHIFDGLDLGAPQDKIDEAYDALRDWLKSRGVVLFHILYSGAMDEILNTMKYYNQDIFYMLLGSSGETNHAVICKNDEIVHDPCPEKPGLTGPANDGFFWVYLLLPLWHKEAK